MSLLPTWTIEQQDQDLARAAAAGNVVRLGALLPMLRWNLGDRLAPIDRSIRLDEILAYTPLAYAAQGGHLEAIALLLEYGAQVNHLSQAGHAALHEAVMHQQSGALDALVAAGADLHLRSALGYTPLQLAVAVNAIKVVPRLLDLGVDPNEAGGQGNTPLHIAMETKDSNLGPLVTLLMERGADPTRRNANGLTPQEWACSSLGAGADSAAARALVAHLVRQERQTLNQAMGPTTSPVEGIDGRRRL